MHADRMSGVAVMLAAVAVFVGAATLAAPAAAGERHHIALGLGFTKLLSDDMKDETLDADLSNAGHAYLQYRISLNPSVDLAIESRATASHEEVLGTDVTMTGTYFGPGVRWVASSASPRPYLQANVYFVNEKFEVEESGFSFSDDEDSIGFGVMGGVDIRLNNLLTLPLELHYLYATPDDDISGLGMSVGLGFNFGAMP